MSKYRRVRSSQGLAARTTLVAAGVVTLTVTLLAWLIPGALISGESGTPSSTGGRPADVMVYVLGALAAAAAGAGVVPALAYLNRVRYRDVRVALTGQPRAGKTMFSVSLFNALLSERAGRVEFTAEARTVISVYQAINNVGKGVWPQSTPLDVVNRYEGRIRYGSSRIAVDLELGDSAGEYWASLDADGDASYLNYVVSADGLVHVIPADELVHAGEVGSRFSFTQERNDLQLASRLSRGTRKRQHLLVAISKLDLIVNDPGLLDDVCLRVWDAQSGRLSSTLGTTLGEAGPKMALFLQSLASEFASVGVTFSSITPHTVGAPQHEGISEWLFYVARAGRRASASG